MISFARFLQRKQVRAWAVFALGAILLIFLIFIAQTPCSGFLLQRRLCLYLKTPLVWVAPDVTLPTPIPEILATEVIPASINPDEIKGSQKEQLALSMQAVGGNPGGFIGIYAPWKEQFGEHSNLYIVDESRIFTGELSMGIFNFPEPLSFIAACLLDFVQVPCSPTSTISQEIVLESEKPQNIPISLSGLQRGLHDLVVVLWPALQSVSPDSSNDQRLTSYIRAFRTSLAVEGDTTPPQIEYQSLPLPQHVFGLEGLVVSPERHPWDEYGAFPPFTYISVKPGEEFELYLHLFNIQDVRVDYALSAFIDYQQVPIAYNGLDYMPLYVSTKANTWYPVPIKLNAPLEPGHHEFIILGEHFPQARLDLESSLYKNVETLSLDVWSSYRIYLDVMNVP